jgi:hypothetical protein
MGDSFVRALAAVVQGTRQLEDFATTLLTSAVEDVLLCVARDYGHDYTVLVQKYRDSIVDRHASSGSSTATCAGKTTSGKSCSRKAVCKGYCRGHASQFEEEESKRRKTVAYRNAVQSTKADGIGGSTRIISNAAYCIRKKDARSFL